MQINILTGTIGSGKSAVADILRKLGAAVIDSDAVARAILDPGTPAFREVVEKFGPGILAESGGIDRKKLAARVFNDSQALSALNCIIHPRVDNEVEALFDQYQKARQKAVFVEMAFIAPARWMDRVERVWVVKAPQDVALKRLEERGLSRAEALARLANQPAPEKQIKQNPEIIANDGTLDELERKVAKLWNKMDNKER